MTCTEKIIKTLKEALPTLKNLKDNFYIIGSAALLLSDIKIDNISDIDSCIQSTFAGQIRPKTPADNLFGIHIRYQR